MNMNIFYWHTVRFVLLQVKPTSKKICTKCDLLLTNFKLLEVIVLQSNSSPTLVPQSNFGRANKQEGSSASYSGMLKASENAKSKSSSSSSKTNEPEVKKAKKDHFEINEKVWYYDRRTKQSEIGIITKKETSSVYVVTNNEDDSFHVNIKAISKMEDWFYQYCWSSKTFIFNLQFILTTAAFAKFQNPYQVSKIELKCNRTFIK